jgi:hypothetical protein
MWSQQGGAGVVAYRGCGEGSQGGVGVRAIEIDYSVSTRELASDNVSGERSTCRRAHLSAWGRVTNHDDHITNSHF